eukprot:GHVU01021436.1.p1 GENE.GHVU01021436.1~~GHVU01021436.1.p1  ORF type:complete len:100 (+),score=0.22 GHVU01021436.1:363-662(+)
MYDGPPPTFLSSRVMASEHLPAEPHTLYLCDQRCTRGSRELRLCHSIVTCVYNWIGAKLTGARFAPKSTNLSIVYQYELPIRSLAPLSTTNGAESMLSD